MIFVFHALEGATDMVMMYKCVEDDVSWDCHTLGSRCWICGREGKHGYVSTGRHNLRDSASTGRPPAPRWTQVFLAED